ncbi:MBL fold metallo-hydrolase [Bacillus sp. NP157]|nr:MBL fold metallo-hydrolase [Bacillus sp. NP157]
MNARPLCLALFVASMLGTTSFNVFAGGTTPAASTQPSASFRIGEMTAMSINDGSLTEPNDGKSFVTDQSPAAVATLLTKAGLPGDHVELAIHPLLVKAGTYVLLFDSGAGRYFGPASGKLPASLAQAGVDPATVTDIFISHTHGDHIGGLVTMAGKLFFPKATIHMSAPEWQWLSHMKDADGAKIGVPDVERVVATIRSHVAAFQPGATVLPGLVKAVEIDGHTPGHSGYDIGTAPQDLFYVGDAMHSSVVSVEQPAWKIAFDNDPATAEASRVALVPRLAASGQRIFAVHFPFPGVGKIVRKDGSYAWQPELLP